MNKTKTSEQAARNGSCDCRSFLLDRRHPPSKGRSGLYNEPQSYSLKSIFRSLDNRLAVRSRICLYMFRIIITFQTAHMSKKNNKDIVSALDTVEISISLFVLSKFFIRSVFIFQRKSKNQFFGKLEIKKCAISLMHYMCIIKNIIRKHSFILYIYIYIYSIKECFLIMFLIIHI